MAGKWRGQNLRKTVGECEIEVGRHKHMHETRQCSCVLLQGTDECCVLLPVEGWSLSTVLSSSPLSRSRSLFRVAGGQLCLARSVVEVSL